MRGGWGVCCGLLSAVNWPSRKLTSRPVSRQVSSICCDSFMILPPKFTLSAGQQGTNRSGRYTRSLCDLRVAQTDTAQQQVGLLPLGQLSQNRAHQRCLLTG